MFFNLDPTKPTQEVFFSRKNGDSARLNISFNDTSVERVSHQQHLRIYLDERLIFKMHIETVSCKVNKGISIIKNLRHTLPRKPLLAIYKAFRRPHIDYGDIIYDQPFNESFCEKLVSFQYKTAVFIIGVIQDTSKEKRFTELGLESLKLRRWFRHLCCMFKIMKN